MTDESMRARLIAALPWYVNGTLAESERAWVDAYLRQHPEALGDVHLMRLIRQEVQATAAERAPDAGLDALLHRIRASAAPPPPVPWRQRLARWFARPPFAPAFAVALILVQAGTIAFLAAERHTDAGASLGQPRSAEASLAAGAVLRVSFKPEAREIDIRMLLVRSGSRIVGGPGQLGGYLIAAGNGRLDAALAEFTASPWVASVKPLPRMPERAE